MKRRRERERDEAVAREEAARRREGLLARLKAQEEATRKPADGPEKDEPEKDEPDTDEEPGPPATDLP